MSARIITKNGVNFNLDDSYFRLYVIAKSAGWNIREFNKIFGEIRTEKLGKLAVVQKFAEDVKNTHFKQSKKSK